ACFGVGEGTQGDQGAFHLVVPGAVVADLPGPAAMAGKRVVQTLVVVEQIAHVAMGRKPYACERERLALTDPELVDVSVALCLGQAIPTQDQLVRPGGGHDE